MNIVIALVGLALILIGIFGVFSNWQRLNTGLKSAEKMAPVITSGATLLLGIVILFRWLDIWVAIFGLVLFALGYLLRGPSSVKNR